MKERCFKCIITENLIQVGNKWVCNDCLNKIRLLRVNMLNELNPDYEHMTFDSFINHNNTNSIQTCKEFALGKSGLSCLMLYSKSAGNGKTHLSIATVKYWLINTWIPKYCDGDMPKTFSVIPEHILFHEIRKTFTENNGVSEIDIIRKHSKADILIMDDIGKYSVADLAFIQRVWFSIIDERCGYKRPTILTTNKTGQQLKHHFGDYTFDRLRGMSGGKITEIIGESKR